MTKTIATVQSTAKAMIPFNERVTSGAREELTRTMSHETKAFDKPSEST